MVENSFVITGKSVNSSHGVYEALFSFEYEDEDDADYSWICFYILPDEPIQPGDSTVDAGSLEISIPISGINSENIVGEKFSLESGYDDDEGDYLAMFYCYEHNLVNKITVEVKEKVGDDYLMSITAAADDMFKDCNISVTALFKKTDHLNVGCC